jgi:outer membrane protein assembly factor BamB
VCGFDNGRVAAYSLSDGSQLWEVLLEPPTGRNEVERLVDVNAAVQVAGNDVYGVSYQGRVAALALESGQVLWSQEFSSHSGLAVDADTVYVAGQDSSLAALARNGGASRWSTDLLKNRDITGPVAFQSSVVVGDFEGYLHWFDAASGEPQARVRAGRDRITAPPVVLNDLLFVLTDGGQLVAFRQQPR